MALDLLNRSNLEQLALKGLIYRTHQHYHCERLQDNESGQVSGDEPEHGTDGYGGRKDFDEREVF